MLNHYIATTLSAKSTDAEAQQPDYLERFTLYQAFDGQEGRRDWRTPSLTCCKSGCTGSQNVQAKGRAGFPGGDEANQPNRGCEVSQDDL